MPAPYDLFDYVAYWKGRSYEDNSERIALEYFFGKISIGASLIDVGGGFGRLCVTYADRFENCLIIDPSEKNLKTGREMFADCKNVNFTLGALPKLDVGNNSFDVAVSIRVIHHLVDPLPSFKEISRIVKPGGWFILEAANKIHFWAKIKALLTFNFNFLRNKDPVERRSLQSIKERKITFVNHHPERIISDLKKSGFEVKEILSVSNFRCSLLKKIMPQKLLLFLEKKLQKPLSLFFFGPSIFFLLQKGGI